MRLDFCLAKNAKNAKRAPGGVLVNGTFVRGGGLFKQTHAKPRSRKENAERCACRMRTVDEVGFLSREEREEREENAEGCAPDGSFAILHCILPADMES